VLLLLQLIEFTIDYFTDVVGVAEITGKQDMIKARVGLGSDLSKKHHYRNLIGGGQE
jgi:hypothetical protein